MLEIKLTTDTAQAVLVSLRDHINQRTTVREYVDKRYFHMDEAFRNRKIGEVQVRLDQVQAFIDRLQTAVSIQPQGESK